MGAHLMVVHSGEEQVHPGSEWDLGPVCCLPFLLRWSFVDLGVGAVAEGLSSSSWKGCFSLGILHPAPAAVN